MSVHPDGSGTGWTNVEAVDVNQPHGKDYLYCQHIAKGVRKRMNAEHAAFADATVGGIHVPGGCAVLGIEDGTATVIADGTLVGHGIVWDNTEALWCCTKAAGASTTGDWTILQMNPNTQWKGGDVTWAGNHQFDSSVDFSDVDITGSLLVDSSADFSHAFFDGTVIATNLEVTGAAIFDGTSNFYDEIDFSSFNVSGLAGIYGSFKTQDSDAAALVGDVTYKASSDGLLIMCTSGSTNNKWKFKQASAANVVTVMGQGYYAAAGTIRVEVATFPIKKDYYWCISLEAATLSTCYWIPFGDGSCDKNI
ncbi:MAG: hypothetical protein MUO31_06905 [Thermodesulfovibrionales bacterium]|nr:hypothetical protein [Thermodesulfovibrionales bacterium]